MNKTYVLLISFFTLLSPSDKDSAKTDTPVFPSTRSNANLGSGLDNSNIDNHAFVNVVNDATQDTDTAGKKSSVLVDADWLAANLKSENLRLIGLGQTKAQYDAAHIPSEVFINWQTEITDPETPDHFTLPPREQYESLMGRLGITAQTTVVISDNLNSRLSARMFWTLRYYGHKKIKLLDGGRKAWIQSGRSFVKAIPKIVPTSYKVKQVNQRLHASLKQVRDHLEKKDTYIVDGRFPNQFSGKDEAKTFHNNKVHKRKGHILNAHNVPWPDNFNDNGTFKSPEQLQKLYTDAGFKTGNQVITYCNEGLHAAPPWFVLSEILGNPEIRLYDSSLAEWANREDTPMTTTSAKK